MLVLCVVVINKLTKYYDTVSSLCTGLNGIYSYLVIFVLGGPCKWPEHFSKSGHSREKKHLLPYS